MPPETFRLSVLDEIDVIIETNAVDGETPETITRLNELNRFVIDNPGIFTASDIAQASLVLRITATLR